MRKKKTETKWKFTLVAPTREWSSRRKQFFTPPQRRHVVKITREFNRRGRFEKLCDNVTLKKTARYNNVVHNR